MIVILGSILAKPDTFEALRKLGVEHSARSRAEPGCVAHNVHVDCENPLRIVFVEKWKDQAAVAQHFKVKASIDFVMKARELGAAPPMIDIYDGKELPFG